MAAGGIVFLFLCCNVRPHLHALTIPCWKFCIADACPYHSCSFLLLAEEALLQEWADVKGPQAQRLELLF